MDDWIDDGRKHTRWCFTLCNWTDTEVEKIREWEYVRFLIFGKENCPKTGTPHLQGYVEWNNERKFSTVKKLNKRINWRPSNGDAKSNIKYCSKEDPNPYTRGEPAKQGERSDLLACKEMIDNGCSELEVAEEHFTTWAGNYKALERYKLLKQKHRTTKPKCIWLWGLAGVGKSEYIHKHHNVDDIYIKDGTKWWNGYDQQEVVLIDDFDGKWPYRDLLRLLDRYRYQSEVKGNYVKINSPFIYITCEHHPNHFWFGNELTQVTRRLDEIYQIHPSGEVSGNTSSDTTPSESEILG